MGPQMQKIHGTLGHSITFTVMNTEKKDVSPGGKLDCILSACRGMSHGMGIDIMSVELSRVSKEHKVNKTLVSNAQPERFNREHNKIEALTQTLA
eukprot:IDg16861t1